jgi:small conductance mechanosensitive channel
MIEAAAAVDAAMQPTTWERLLERTWDTVVTMGADYGLRTLGAVAILVVGYFAARMMKSALIRAGRRAPHVDMTVVTFVASLAKYGILAFTAVAMLSSFGVQTASVVAVIGAAGLAIGLALQGTLGHVASGFMLILFRPFRVGDAIETAGVSGTVREVSLFTTEILTADNVRIIIPNSSVWSGVTRNLTTNPVRRSDLEFTVATGNDVDQVLRLVREAVAAEPLIQREPAPFVGIVRQNEAGIRIACQVWSRTGDMPAVQTGIYRTVLKAFAETGVALPQAAARLPVKN